MKKSNPPPSPRKALRKRKGSKPTVIIDSSFPNIPEIPAHLHMPIQTLANSADFLRSVILKSASGIPILEVLQESEATARLAEEVINVWRKHLGIADDEAQ